MAVRDKSPYHSSCGSCLSVANARVRTVVYRQVALLAGEEPALSETEGPSIRFLLSYATKTATCMGTVHLARR